MKKPLLFITLPALLFIAGCSTTTAPTTPAPHPDKYALQIIRIEIPASDTKSTSLFVPVPTKDIETLLSDPNATITEFPIVYAAIGETAINDQTETISAPESYEAKANTNGVVSVVYSAGTTKVGRYVEMTLQKVEDSEATCDLWFYEKTLRGMHKYDVAPATENQEAVTASLPMFKVLETKTEVTLVPGAWISMGGLTGTKKEGDQSTPTTIYFAIRILPPQE